MAHYIVIICLKENMVMVAVCNKLFPLPCYESNKAFRSGHLHNHVGLTENFDQSENEEFLVNDSP